MSRLIVLKFGGSVLAAEDTLPLAVHEIYRWRRRGWDVVAVVSALAGSTDGLLEKARALCPSPGPRAVAALVSNGEAYSAALLGAYLDRAGVAACALSPGAVGLTAAGPALDAVPIGLDSERIRAALERDEVVVLPGYVAHDDCGRPMLLGRGGSDLTALFVAERLGAARCRLVKDVDGLYERDPALPGPPARRFARATWDDALATDGSILQHKAVRFARERRVEFELGRLNGTRPTRVGAGPRHFAAGPDRPARLRVALLGLGTVGTGVFELLRGLPDHFEWTAVAVRDPDRERPGAVPPELLTGDAVRAARSGADVVVEVMGGVDRACEAMSAALASGAHVVTANKRALADAGERLSAAARRHGRTLCASASVGGSMPLLERLTHRPMPDVAAVRGVVNATSNYVLDRLGRGSSLDAAVRAAQANGFAERDPSRDLSGQDAADKLGVIALQLGLSRQATGTIASEPLSSAAVAGFAPGSNVRQVASLHVAGAASRGHVRLSALAPGDPLARASAEHNAAVIDYRDGTRAVVRGKGAGRWPTAEAVVADLLGLAREAAGELPMQTGPGRRVPLRPGVFAERTGAS